MKKNFPKNLNFPVLQNFFNSFMILTSLLITQIYHPPQRVKESREKKEKRMD